MTADPSTKASLLVTAQFTLLGGQLFLRPRNGWSTTGGVRRVHGTRLVLDRDRLGQSHQCGSGRPQRNPSGSAPLSLDQWTRLVPDRRGNRRKCP